MSMKWQMADSFASWVWVHVNLTAIAILLDEPKTAFWMVVAMVIVAPPYWIFARIYDYRRRDKP